jgi:hypothetical protein
VRPGAARLLHARWPVWALCAAGVAERVAWTLLQPAHGAAGEAMNVAVSLGAGRGFAGAYGVGHGATAHLLPLGPAVAGMVYGVLAPRSAAAEAILATWSIALAIGTYLLLFRAFAYLGIARGVRLACLALGLLTPAYLTVETVDFRVWEGGLATFLAALFLYLVLATRARVGEGPRDVRRFPLGLLACASLLFFVHPPLGLSAFVCLAVLGVARMPWRANVIGAATALALAAVAGVPWAIRNERVLGAFVPLRSNAGLELALANNRAMSETDDPARTLEQRLLAIHPTANPAARREAIRIGEVAYARQRGEEAKAWIAAHPADAARLWLRHVRQMLLPERWMSDPRGTAFGAVRAWFVQGIGVAGLLGLVALLLGRGRAAAVYPAIMVVLTTVMLAPFQPVTRYTYILYPGLCFLIGGVALWMPAASRRGMARRS